MRERETNQHRLCYVKRIHFGYRMHAMQHIFIVICLHLFAAKDVRHHFPLYWRSLHSFYRHIAIEHSTQWSHGEMLRMHYTLQTNRKSGYKTKCVPEPEVLVPLDVCVCVFGVNQRRSLRSKRTWFVGRCLATEDHHFGWLLHFSSSRYFMRRVNFGI